MNDHKLLTLLQQAAMESRAGAQSLVHGIKVEEITYEEVLKRSLQGVNLEIAQQQEALAAAALEKSEAKFDIGYGVSFSHNRYKSYERSDRITRRYTPTAGNMMCDVNNDGVFDSSDDPTVTTEAGCDAVGGSWEYLPPCVTVDGEGSCLHAVNIQTVNEYASSEMDEAQVKNTLSATLTQPLRWGASVSTTLSTSHNDRMPTLLQASHLIASQTAASATTAFGQEHRYLAAKEDPFLLGSKFPWSSSVSLSLSSRLPYAKGFGEHGEPLQVAIKQAVVSQEKSEVSSRIVKRQRVASVDRAWWKLARSGLNLLAAQRNIKNTRHMLEHVRKLYDQHQATEYDYKQAEAGYQEALDEEELRWGNYLLHSTALSRLISPGQESIYCPIQLQGALEIEALTELTDAQQLSERIDRAYQRRPELELLRKEIQSRDVELKHKQNALLPDLSLSMSARLSQNDTVMGYRGLGDSLSNLFNPDARDLSIGLSFRIPFENRAAKQAVSKARVAKMRDEDRMEERLRGIAKEIRLSMNDLMSNQQTVKMRLQQLQLAEIAMEQARQLMRAGKITTFTLLEKSQDLLDATYGYIDALISRKQAEATLLSAEGELVQRAELQSVGVES